MAVPLLDVNDGGPFPQKGDKATGAAFVADAAMATAIGTPEDEPWDGVAESATVISLLKRIAQNTDPA